MPLPQPFPFRLPRGPIDFSKGRQPEPGKSIAGSPPEQTGTHGGPGPHCLRKAPGGSCLGPSTIGGRDE